MDSLRIRLAVRLRTAWRFAKRIYEGYDRDSGSLMAAAVAFYGLLSTVPMLSLAVAVLGRVLGSNTTALDRIQDALTDVLPSGGDLVYTTLEQIKQTSGIVGAVSLVGLLIPASAIFTNMEIAFNNMWRVKLMRSWIRQRLLAFWVTLITLSLMLLSIAITSAMTWIQNARVPGFDIRAGEVPIVWQVAGHLLPVLLSISMFTLLYRLVPNCPIRWRKALEGGVFAGLAWELAKYLFATYVAHFANYNRVYGSLGAIVSLMFWAFYTSTILFIGAEIAADNGEEPEPTPAPEVPHAQPREGGG